MSIIKHVTLQKIVAHDFRYDPRSEFICYYKEDTVETAIHEAPYIFNVKCTTCFGCTGPSSGMNNYKNTKEYPASFCAVQTHHIICIHCPKT